MTSTAQNQTRIGRRWQFALAGLSVLLSAAAISGSGTVTVADGEATITNSSNQTLNFAVSSSGDNTYDRFISFSTADGTAVAGTDYTASSGTLKLAAGATTGQIPVTARGKSGSGTLPDKTFTLNLSGLTGSGSAPAFTVNQAVSGTQGGGDVVSLDINGDGKPDLISNNSSFNVVAQINTSAPGATTPTYSAPQQISGIDFARFAVGDADNDGKPDLLITNSGGGQQVLLRNTTITGSATVSFADAAVSLPIGTVGGAGFDRPLLVELTNDGRPDAVMVNASDQQVRVFRNTTPAGGAISFGAAELYNVSISALAVAAADLNNDGKLDIAVGNGALSSTTAAQVLFNQGGSTLLSAAQNVTISSGGNHNADGIATGDYNHDGKADLVLLDRGGGAFPQVVLNTTAIGGSSFTFTAQAVGTTGMTGMIGVAADDFNGDGLLDFAVTDQNGPNNSKPGLHVFQNVTAPGASVPRFVQTAASALSMSFPGKLAITDFNTDGKPDLAAVTNSGGAALDVLVNSTTAPTAVPALSASPNVELTDGVDETVAVDLNGDGRLDLASVNASSSGVVNVALNQTAAGASSVSLTKVSSPATGSFPSEIEAGDLNGDGRPDLAVANEGDATVSVLLNTGTLGAVNASGAQFQTTTLSGFINASDIAIADFNGDGQGDLVVVNAYVGGALQYRRNTTSAGSLSASFAIAGSTALGNQSEVITADFDGDGRPDLVTRDLTNSAVRVLLNTTAAGATTFSFTSPTTVALASAPQGIALGDFDADGKPDLAVGSSIGGTVTILLNRTVAGASSAGGNASLITGATVAVPDGGRGVTVADFNGDGRADVATIQSGGGGKISLLLNQTTAGSDTASFVAGATAFAASNQADLISPDLNSDGRPDLVATDGTASFMAPRLNTQYQSSLTASSATGTIHYNLPAALSLSPTSLNFFQVTVGETSNPLSATLTNTSGSAVALSIPTSVGDFAVDTTPADRCVGTLNAGANCKIYLRFTPTQSGTRDTTLSINSGAVTLSLLGSGAARAPGINFTTGGISFGSISAGGVSTQNVTLRNSGNVPVLLSAPTESGTDTAVFNIISGGTCGTGNTLAVGSTCTYTVQFAPPAGVAKSYSATQIANAADVSNASATATASVIASGTANAAVASLSPTSKDFGSILVGNSSSNQLFTLSNTGNQTLTITSILSDSGEFVINGNGCGTTVSAGGSCQFLVRFAPSASGARSGTVTVLSNAADATAALSGTGVARNAVITPNLTSYNFGTFNNVGGSHTQAITLTNNGNVPLRLDAPTISGTDAAQFTVSAGGSCTVGNTLAVGASCSFNLTFTIPNGLTAPKNFSATATWNTTDTVPSTAHTATTALSAKFSRPVADLSPTSKDYGSVLVGNDSNSTFILSNTGDLQMTINSISAAGSVVSSEYSVNSTTCGGTLAAGASCDIIVRFTPSSRGASTGLLQLNSSGNNVNVNLSGTGLQSGISLSATSLAFGNQRVGVASSALTATITNSGNSPLTVSALNKTGTGAADYSASHTCTNIAAGANCTVSVTFTPSVTGSRTATLSIVSNASGSSAIALSGTGVQADVVLSDSTVNFGNQAKDVAATPRTVTVQNQGGASVSLGQINASSGDFSISNDSCSNQTLAATSGTCTFKINFTPTATGTRSGTFSFTSNSPNSPHSVAVSGTGVQAAISLDKTTLPFGNQRVGVASSAQTVTVTNTGNSPLTISAVNKTGTEAADYTVSNGCTSVAANDTCSISVTFNPGATGARSAGLSIVSNAPTSPSAVTLTGTGVSSALSLPAAVANFGDVNVSTSSSQTLTLTNSGDASLNISSVTLSGTDKSLFSIIAAGTTCGSAPVAANGGTCTVKITFTPGAAPAGLGSKQAALDVVSDASNSPTQMGLSGKGVQATISAAALDFGNQLRGVTSTTKSVTVNNTGSAPLTVSAVTLTGGDAADFTLTNNGCGTVAAGSSCTLDLTFKPGATGQRSTTLNVTSDAQAQPLQVAIGGTGFIPVASLSVDKTTFAESGTGNAVVVTASLSTIFPTGSGIDITVNLAYSGVATSGTDYAAGTSLTIPAGQGSATLTLQATDDAVDEPDESLVIDIDSVVNANENGTQQSTLTLADDDGAPMLSVGHVTVSESAGTVTFTVTKGGATINTVLVDFATQDGTATSANDYSAQTGTLSFAPGELTKTVVVTLTNDQIVESDEAFTLTLSNPVNAALAAGAIQAIATVTNDDNAPVITDAQSFTTTEGTATATVIGTVLGTDANGDALSGWAITGGTGKTLFTLDPATGQLRITDGNSLPAGSYTIEMTVTDGFNTSALRSANVTVAQKAVTPAPTPATPTPTAAQSTVSSGGKKKGGCTLAEGSNNGMGWLMLALAAGWVTRRRRALRPVALALTLGWPLWAAANVGGIPGALPGRVGTEYPGLVDGGTNHSCAIKSDGTIQCWGHAHANRTNAPAGTYTQLSTSGDTSCALSSSGGLACWGFSTEITGAVPNDGPFVQVSTGFSYACALRGNGTIECWGAAGIVNGAPSSGVFRQIAASNNHACAIKNDHTLVCWGDNTDGKATAPAGTFLQVALSFNHSCGIKTDGTVACWGGDTDGQVSGAPSGSSFVQIAISSDNSCGLSANGEISCWGAAFTPPPGAFQQIGSGGGHFCGLKLDGALACAGRNTQGQSSPPSGAHFGRRAIATANDATCEIRKDGTLSCWGNNSEGQATPPVGTFSQIGGGSSYFCGLPTSGGNTLCWGASYKPTTPLTGPLRQFQVNPFLTCGLSLNGSASCSQGLGHVTPPTGVGHTHISNANSYEACFLNSGGQGQCSGLYPSGQPPVATEPFRQIVNGSDYSCGLKVDGGVVCWGSETRVVNAIPASQFRQIDGGTSAVCGILASGGLQCWGSSSYSINSPPVGEYVQLSVTGFHGCALSVSDEVHCWGNPSSGKAPQGLTLSPATLSNGEPNVAYGPVALSMTEPNGYTPVSPTFTVKTGSLPAGMSITGANLGGTPSASGTSTFTLQGKDANGFVAERAYSLTIAAAPITVNFAGASSSKGEAGGGHTLTVTLSAAPSGTVTVPFSVQPSSSASNNGSPPDFTISSSPLTFSAGQTSKTITVTPVNDNVVGTRTDENDETVVVDLGTPTGAVLGSVTRHTVTITDDDTAEVSFASSALNQSTDEDQGSNGAGNSVVYTVQLSMASDRTVTIPYSISGGTATLGTDVAINASSPSPRSITAGQSPLLTQFVVTTVHDVDDEPDETAVITLGTPTNAVLAASNTSTSLAILDNDEPIRHNLSPSTLNFGNSAVGQPTATQVVTLKNTGNTPLQDTNQSGINGHSSDFEITTSTCPSTLAPNATCTHSIRFKPTTTGARTATFTAAGISSGRAGEFVTLTGTGVTASAALTVTPPAHFGSRAVGSTSSALNAKVTNTGNVTITLGTPSITGDFALSNNGCTGGLAPGADCNLAITFTPTATGARSGSLGFTSNAPNSPHSVALSGTGTLAAITLQGFNGSFGSQRVGQASTAQNVTVRNTGTESITVGTPTITGAHSSNFAISNNGCVAALAANATCTLSLTFTPSTTGSRSATLNVPSNATAGTQTLSLGGSGIAPSIAATPNPLAFGSVTVGTTSGASTLTVSNAGSAPLAITTTTIGGTDAARFTLGTNTCANSSVAAGANCTIQVSFSPTSTGSQSATLTIKNDAGADQVVALSGSGVQAGLSANPSPLSFGNQAVGSTTAAQTVTLTNTGSSTLNVTAFNLTGGNSGDFTVGSNTCVGNAIAANATCTVSLTFTPAASGARSSTLRISSNASDGTHDVTLNGTGTQLGIEAPASVAFGSQRVGQDSVAKTVTVKNTGNQDLSISAANLTGANSGDYRIDSNGCTALVTSGQSCTIGVIFKPTTVNVRSASLQIASNAPNSPSSIPLDGTGIAPALTAPTSQVFGSQVVGQTSSPASVELKNTGTDSLSLGAITLGGAGASQYNLGSNACANKSLAIGASCLVSVTFSPSALGTQGATLTIAHDAGADRVVNLSGTGVQAGLSANPSPLSFGNQLVGSASAAQTLTLTNPGSAPLTIGSISLTGDNAAEFTLGNHNCTAIAAGASCTVPVTFTPAASGTRSATLSITSDAPGAAHTVALSGSGIQAVLDTLPTTIDLGEHVIGTTQAQSFLLKNSGGASMTLGDLTVTGTNASEFVISRGDCSSTLAAGASCTASLSFTPSAVGDRSATLTVSSNAPGSPHSSTLTGKGKAAPATTAPAAQPAPTQTPAPVASTTSTGKKKGGCTVVAGSDNGMGWLMLALVAGWSMRRRGRRSFV